MLKDVNLHVTPGEVVVVYGPSGSGKSTIIRCIIDWRSSRIGEVLDVRVKLASEGMTMCVVPHEMGFARQVAHRVIFMDEGCLVETGKPHDLFANPQTDRAAQFISKILTH